MAIPSIEDLMGAEVGSSDFPLIPAGDYNGVITKSEVRKGAKGPYLAVMVTIHDEEYKGQVVWGNASFSEKALTIPGAAGNLMQASGITIDLDTAKEDIPAAVNLAIISQPVGISVKQDQVKRNGELQTNDDGTPEMRAGINGYVTAADEFIESVELDAQGLDDDLPF